MPLILNSVLVSIDRNAVDIRNRPRIPVPDEDPYSIAGTRIFFKVYRTVLHPFFKVIVGD